MPFSRRSIALGSVALGALPGFVARGAVRPAAKAVTGGFGLDLAAMDRSVAPGDDFYRYVNGGWLKTATIPPDRARWQEFYRLDDLNAKRSRDILEEAARAPTSPQTKAIGDFYASLMDEAGREAAGLSPLQPELARIAAIATPADLARAIAQVSRDWLRPLPGGASPLPPSPLATGVSIDQKNPTRYLPSISQGGLGMPDRDYFLVDDPRFLEIRAAYRKHLAAMFALAGLDDPQARAGRVYDLEERLARSHATRAEQRDPDKRYNLFTRAALAAQAPGLDWPVFLDAAGFKGQDLILVSEVGAAMGVALAAEKVALADWKDYLAYRSIRAFAPFGPRAIVAENFAFEDGVLAGTPQMPQAWKRAVATLDRSMGQAVGAIYLQKFFPPESRAVARTMTANIIAALGRRIAALDWMAPATKARALKKLAAARVEVGAEAPPRSYAGLTVVRTEAFGNVQRAARFAYERGLSRLGKPVDRAEWSMVAQTVNAQANPTLVKIMFPAGIMQGLFFDPAADPAVNYGAIGVVMGHELSHLFDDQGSKFDETGALNNWWTPEDFARFHKATEALAAQYDTYEPLPGAHINGHLTNGENIADLAGLALARDAYFASLGGKTPPVIGGLTADQRFFMSFAQLYRGLTRENFLRQMLATDPHSPGEWRAAEVRNMDAWYEAFGVKPGQKMYLAPAERVRIW